MDPQRFVQAPPPARPTGLDWGDTAYPRKPKQLPPNAQEIPAKYITISRLESVLNQHFPAGNYNIEVPTLRSFASLSCYVFCTYMSDNRVAQLVQNIFTVTAPYPLSKVNTPKHFKFNVLASTIFWAMLTLYRT